MNPAAILAGWWIDFLIMAIFLTRLPFRFVGEIEPDMLTRALRAMPLVGTMIGIIGALIFGLAWWLDFPVLLAALMAIAATVLVTGSFHEDGLADVADGFGGGRTKTDKLKILRDSRIGTHGTMALVLAVTAKIAAIGGLGSVAAAMGSIVAAHALARGLVPGLMRVLPPVRRDGLGTMAGVPAPETVLLAAVLGLLIAMFFAGIGPALLAALVATGGIAMVGFIAQRQIGGYTGDVLGAAEQIAEIAILATLAALA